MATATVTVIFLLGWGINQTRMGVGCQPDTGEDGYQPYMGGTGRWVSTRHGWD